MLPFPISAGEGREKVMPQVAIVTGGTYGIGRAIALTLAAKGWRVVAFGLEARQIGSMAQQGIAGTRKALEVQGLSADLLEADVSKPSDVQRVVDFALAQHGRIDALVNNAAIHPSGAIVNTPLDVWQRVLDVNLTGMFICAQAVLPHLLKQRRGVIVNIGSGSGWGKPNLLAYCASKGGVHAFTMALAYDHIRDRVRVNMVIPGSGTQTGMNEGIDPESRPATVTVTGRPTMPQDVANAVSFLLSDEAEQITGTVIDVGAFANQGGPIPGRK